MSVDRFKTVSFEKVSTKSIEQTSNQNLYTAATEISSKAEQIVNQNEKPIINLLTYFKYRNASAIWT